MEQNIEHKSKIVRELVQLELLSFHFLSKTI